MIRFVDGFALKSILLISIALMLGITSPLSHAIPQFELLQSFGEEVGTPVGKLIHDSAGNIYGVTGSGGESHLGSLFKIDTSGRYSVLHTFKGADGESPRSGVIFGTDGKLYGTTYGGGDHGAGTIYQLDPSTATPAFTVLHHFTSGANGGYPLAALLQGADGKFYGTTPLGGEGFGAGTIFELDMSGAAPAYRVLHTFDGIDGWYPGSDSLVQDSNGKIYGITPLGGSGNAGTLFELDISGAVAIHKVLHHFTYATNAGNPTAVIVGNDGNLYGTTDSGNSTEGGNIFRLDLTGSTPIYTVLYVFDFANAPEIGKPIGDLTQATDGNLYGTTFNGGTSNNGTVFRLDIAKSTANYNVLHAFDGINSAKPQAGVDQNVDGKLYGSTTLGGLSGKGTVFQLDVSGALPKYKDIHNFAGSGKRPNHLIQGKDGYLYGANSDDLFKFDPTGNKPATTVLATLGFSDRTEYNRVNGLLQARDNKFYGIFENYSIDFAGMFRLDTLGTLPKYEVIADLPHYRSNSPRPRGLIQASNGKFYGTTLTGGIDINGGLDGSGGTVYQYDLSGGTPTYSMLHAFDGINGRNPSAGVIQASDGKLYGTTVIGGRYNLGTIFRIDISGTKPVHTVLHHFDGEIDSEGLIQGKDGKLYGFGAIGPTGGKGVFYQLDIAGATPVYRVLYTFDFVGPASYLTQSRDGKFYGVAKSAGGQGKGIVFQLDVAGSSPAYKVLYAFDGTTGESPSGLLLANDGNLYGTTEAGGEFNRGVIYRIKRDNTRINNAPTANNDSYVLKMPWWKIVSTLVAPGVLKNDKDADGDKLTVFGATKEKPKVIVFPKGAGKVSLYPGGRLIYTRSRRNFIGSQSFTYRATDGKAISNPATVTLTIKYR